MIEGLARGQSQGSSPQEPPHIAYDGATLVMDFPNRIFRLGDQSYRNATSLLNLVRTTPGWRTARGGQIVKELPNVPRISVDPVSGRPDGLLTEETRTNLLTSSSDMVDAAWGKDAVAVTQSAVPSPIAGAFFQSVVVTTLDASQGVESPDFVANGSSVYTASFYVLKSAAPGVEARLYFRATLTTGKIYGRVDINSATGSLSSGLADATDIKFGVKDYGAYWRVWLASEGIPAGNMKACIRLTNEPVSAQVDLAGAQTEEGSFPTSVIPTDLVAVQRTKDVCTVADVANWFNEIEGTFVVDMRQAIGGAITSVGHVIQASDGTNDNRITIRTAIDNSVQLIVVAGNVVTAHLNGTIPDDVTTSVAAAFGADGATLYVDGVEAATDMTVALPNDIDTFNIGSNALDAAYANGTIQRLLYFPTKLTLAELAALAT
ncbi:MAG: phage head spike fiber domain-containing protein [Octadecabacter sp.]